MALCLLDARAGDLDHVGVVVEDPDLSNEYSIPLCGTDDPGLGHGDVVDAEEILDLVWRSVGGHMESKPLDRFEHGPPSCDRACPLPA